jgi:hypothetical protein
MTETGGMVSLLLAAIGGLWLYHRAQIESRLSDIKQLYDKRIEDRDKAREEDKQRHKQEIEERDKRISDLESKAEKAADVLGKNTAALAQNAESQARVVEMLSDLLGPTDSQRSNRNQTR